MPGIDDTLINELLSHTDIVAVISSYIPVTKKGRNYVAICPFHDDTSPSLTISPEKQIYKCFSCGAAGNAISFVANYEKIPYYDAVRKVAELVGFSDERLEKRSYSRPIDKDKEALYKCLEDLTSYYQLALGSEEGTEAMNYLESRGLDASIREKFRLGYAPNDGAATCSFLQGRGHSLKTIEDSGVSYMANGQPVDKYRGRVIFPLTDINGRVIGFSARALDKEAESKYINTQETPIFHKSSVLYNIDHAKEASKQAGYVYVTEGFMDVIALERAGISSAVAIMGTALTKEHIALLRQLRCEVRLCLDGDLAGQEATMKASNLLAKSQITYRIVDAGGDSRDLDEILESEGKEALVAHISRLSERLDFALAYYEKTNPLKTNEDRKKLINSFLPILYNLKDPMDKENYIYKLAEVTGYNHEIIRNELAKYRPPVEANTTIREIDKTIHDATPVSEQKELRRLRKAQADFLHQMIKTSDAICYYRDNNVNLEYQPYRAIADYLVEMESQGITTDLSTLIGFIAARDNENEETKQYLTQLATDIEIKRGTEKVPYTTELVADYVKTMQDEMEKTRVRDALRDSVEGKPQAEKARIYTYAQKSLQKQKK